MTHAIRGRRRAVAAAALAFLALAAAPTAAATFTHRTVVTIDHTRVPDADLLPLANFPVLVSVTHNNLRTTANGGFVTSSRGDDILFQGEDGPTCGGASPCRLAHEIESYDGVSGTIVAWVRVPGTIFDASDGANTPVYMYYGDATITCSQENKAGVWDASYREVLHLNGSDEHTDSTANAFTAAGRGAVTTTAAGKVGRAVDLASSASGLVPAHLNVSDGTLPTATSFTFAAWVQFRTINAGQYIGLVTKGRECLNFDGDPDPGGGFCTSAPCGDWTGLYRLPDGSGNQVFSFEWAYGTPCKAAGMQDPRLAAANVATGTWYHVAGSFDSATSTRRLLVNGTQVATDTLGACIEAPIPHYTRLGTDSNQDYLDGQLDEVRISFAARSNDWIATGYNNQNAPYVGAGGFYSSIAHSAGPFSVTATACAARNPCAGGPGTCNLRSIGTAVNYTTGTVSATNGSSVVTGTGGSWQSANRGRGDRITIDGTDYTILDVDAETQLRLTSPFTGTTGSGKAYTIARKFATLQAWESCIDGPGGAGCEGVSSGSLVADNRSEVGVVYKDSVFTAAGTFLDIDGSTTDSAHTITLTADGPNRHHGVSGAGVVIDNAANLTRALVLGDQHVTVEWLEVRNGGGSGAHCIDYVPSDLANQAVIRNNLVRSCAGQGIRVSGSSTVFRADITNNIVYGGAREGIAVNSPLGTGTGSLVRILNNTLRRNAGSTEISTLERPNPYVVLQNNIVVDDTEAPDLTWNSAALCTSAANCDWWNAASGNNITGDAAPPAGQWQPDLGPNPRGTGLSATAEASLSFVNTTAGSENLHIQAGSAAWNRGSDLTGPVNGDIDATIRTAPWDVGADELPASSAPPLVVWSDVAASAPRALRYSTLQGAAWTAPGLTAVPGPFSTGAPLFSKVARTHPNGTRRAAVASENDGAAGGAKLQVSLFDGTNWDNGLGAPFSDAQQFTSTLSTPMTMRHFDAAYEQLSGELLLVSGANTDDTIFIWTYDGTAWSANLYFTPLGNGQIGTNSEDLSNTFRWIRLEPRPGTNQIAFIGSATDGSTGDSSVISAAIWNGNTNTFGSKNTLSLPVSGPDGITPQNPHITDGIDIDYVLGGTNAGEAVAVWGTQTRVWRSIVSTAGTWGGRVSIQDLGAGNTVRWLRQKAASNSDNMILAIEDVNERIYTIRYDGDTRAFASFTAVPHSTTAFGNADQNRPFDVAWDLGQGANNVLLVYSDTAGIKYRTSSDAGATWSGEQTLTALNQAYWVQLERDPSNVVHLVVMDQASDLRAWKWTAGAWTVTTPSLPSTNLENNSTNQNVETLALATYPPLGSGTTAVKLMSFSAVPGDGSVLLEWRTGSEIDNLGFHVHRGPSADGPWTRLTGSLVPGLGSSPLGQGYSWLDSGLVNGQRYYYRLEDVDTASVSTFHGPVSVVPAASAPPPPEGGGGEGGGSGSGGSTSAGSCPPWVAAAYRQAAPASASATLDCAAYGQPESGSLREVARDARSATLELRTGGFYAVREPAGTVRVFAPGFDFAGDPGAPALPVRRALVEAAVGKKARLASVEALDLRGFARLRPSAVGAAEMQVGADGTVRPARRGAAAPRLSRGYLPQRVAWLAGTVFQGDTKSAVVELSPVRFDGYRQQLVLAERVRVRVVFSGRDGEEAGAGTVGRRVPRKATPFRDVLATLHTARRGLHAVGFEDLFPARQRGMAASVLRLQRRGQPVPFHVEPAAAAFGPGSTLYFYADETAASDAFSSDVAWELVRSAEGRPMVESPAAPDGPAIGPTPTAVEVFEANRVYQPGLLDAPDLWLWDAVVSGAVRVHPFALAGVDISSPRLAELVVHLQGGSDAAEAQQDHHVRVSVNGIDVGEALFDGKRAHALRAEVPASLLREGPNEIALVNVGDTAVSSLVFLDRFAISYPQQPAALRGTFEGAWPQSGTAEVAGVGGPAVVVDLAGSGTAGPTWLTGWETAPGAVRFRAEAGRRYVVATRDGLLAPRVEKAVPSTLRDAANQADYLVIGPRDFLEKAAPLVERRASQGLNTLAVAFEEIADVFGHGQPSAEAIRDFLAFAYHSWSRPSPRYVVLLGDSSYDPRHFQAASLTAPLPALWAKTSYLWTVADPLLAAVNGDDALPDLAIGRLPAQTPAEAEALVSKLLAWEDSGQGLSGAAALVADNPDAGGDFEADIADIASGPLAGRSPQVLRVGELGASTRTAIQAALDSGLSLMSYVGHGGAAVWASENVWNSWDAASLQAQSRQPLLLTLNCLNGYFVAPSFDALAESMLKAEGRGAIAAFSPSGLSLDGPAHAYHRALLAEAASGRHERLGDAVLAAQRAYAQTGLMPELLSVYQLLGDPATSIR